LAQAILAQATAHFFRTSSAMAPAGAARCTMLTVRRGAEVIYVHDQELARDYLALRTALVEGGQGIVAATMECAASLRAVAQEVTGSKVHGLADVAYHLRCRRAPGQVVKKVREVAAVADGARHLSTAKLQDLQREVRSALELAAPPPARSPAPSCCGWEDPPQEGRGAGGCHPSSPRPLSKCGGSSGTEDTVYDASVIGDGGTRMAAASSSGMLPEFPPCPELRQENFQFGEAERAPSGPVGPGRASGHRGCDAVDGERAPSGPAGPGRASGHPGCDAVDGERAPSGPAGPGRASGHLGCDAEGEERAPSGPAGPGRASGHLGCDAVAEEDAPGRAPRAASAADMTKATSPVSPGATRTKAGGAELRAQLDELSATLNECQELKDSINLAASGNRAEAREMRQQLRRIGPMVNQVHRMEEGLQSFAPGLTVNAQISVINWEMAKCCVQQRGVSAKLTELMQCQAQFT